MLLGGVSRVEQALAELSVDRPDAALSLLADEAGDEAAALRVEALVRLRRFDDARAAAADVSGAQARAVVCALLAESFDEAFAQAIAGAADGFERARLQLLYGERLRRERRRAAAREQLIPAVAAFDAAGAVTWRTRAERELEATRRPRRAAGEALTAQEEQVASLVAQGLSNKDTAAKLFVTPKTVEFHLGNVFRKLDVRSRSELAAKRGSATPEPAPAPAATQDALFGRDGDVRRLHELVARARLVTVVGPGGTGKTSVARALAAGSPDAVFVDLSAIRDPALVAWAVARALDVREAGDAPLAEQVRTALAARTTLLILDNFEQVLGASRLAADLAEIDGVRVLVTSRVPLRVAGERVVPLGPLAADPAAELFVARARALDPAFQLAPDAERAVAAIVGRLDGLPLAIELAAARTRLLTPEEILLRLDDLLAFLTRGRRGAPARQQTLRATLDWSFDLLELDGRGLLAQLAVFAGPFDVAAAEGVAGASLDALDALLDSGLLARDPVAPEPRLRLLETVRDYACERLEAAGAVDATRDRHLEHYLERAEEHERAVEAGATNAWRARVALDSANFRAALEWALARGDIDRTLRLAARLGFFWRSQGDVLEGRRWLDAVLEAHDQADHPSLPYVVFCAGSLAGLSGNDLLRVERWERALGLFRRHGNETWVARTLELLCRAYFHGGDAGRAFAAAEAAVDVARGLGSGPELARALAELGELHVYRGEPELALPVLAEAIVLGEPERVRVLAPVYRARGQARLELDDLAGAVVDFETAIELAERHLPARGSALVSRAFTALYADDPETATATFRAVLEIARSDRWLVAAAASGLAAVAARAGDAARAARLLGAAAGAHPGLVLQPKARAAVERAEASARATLGDAYGAEAARGAATGLEGIPALARDPGDPP